MSDNGLESIFKGSGYYRISVQKNIVEVLILNMTDFFDLILLIEEQVKSPVVIKFLSKYEKKEDQS